MMPLFSLLSEIFFHLTNAKHHLKHGLVDAIEFDLREVLNGWRSIYLFCMMV